MIMKGQKMKRKPLTKDEILAITKEAQILKKSSSRSPFTGMATLCNYVLWKDEKWYQKLVDSRRGNDLCENSAENRL